MQLDLQTIFFIMAISGLVGFILSMVTGGTLTRPRCLHLEGRETRERLCARCRECHNPECEAYYELDCADLEGEQDEDERYADLLDCLELMGEAVDLRYQALSRPSGKERPT